jgi:hypothetical protein
MEEVLHSELGETIVGAWLQRAAWVPLAGDVKGRGQVDGGREAGFAFWHSLFL